MDESTDRFDELERRVNQLEIELRDLRAASHTSATAPPRPGERHALPPPPYPQQGLVRPAADIPGHDRTPSTHATPALDSELILKWGGVALVVLAVGFAVSTAISRGWIGPELQLAGAVGVGVALVVIGLRVHPTRPNWTPALCIGGVLVWCTTVASDLFLDRVNADIALGATVAIAAVALALARRLSAQWVAMTGLVGAGLSCASITRDDPTFIVAVVVGVVLVTAGIALALARRWFGLRLAAHLEGLVWFLVAAVAADTDTRSAVALMASAALVASLVRVPSIGDLTSVFQRLEVQATAVTAPWTLAVVSASFDVDDRADVGWLSLMVAAVTVVVALATRRFLHRAHFVSLLLGASVVATIGVATLLSTEAMWVVMAVQAAGLVVVARSLGDSVRLYANAALLALVVGAFVVVRMLEAWTTDAPAGDDLAHLAVIVALAIGLWETRMRVVRRVGAVAVLALLLVWLGSVLKHLPQGQAIVSISWAVVGTTVLVVGVVRKVPEFGTVGLAVLALTVAKLLTIDLQEVDTLWRAGLFLLIGLGLMRLGFLLPKLTARAARSGETDPVPDPDPGVSGSRRASG